MSRIRVNMEDADGETCWRCISFLDRFLFVFASATNWIYVQDEWMFGRSSSMLGVNPRREYSFGIGTQMWLRGAGNYAYTLVGLCFDSTSGEVRWKTTRGAGFFSAWSINSSCESGMQKFKLNVQYLCFCDIETTVHHHMFVTMFIIYDWIYKYM